MSKPKTTQPAPPDPAATAAGQTQTNVQSAIANAYLGNANQVGPTGSVNYNQTGSTNIKDATGKDISIPQFTRTETLSPEQQHLYDQQTALGGQLNDLASQQTTRLGSTLNQPIDFSGLPQRVTSVNNDFSADRQRVEDSIFSRLIPQQDKDRSALDSKLANQGITQGSEAYNNAYNLFNQGTNDARQQAVLAGGSEQSRMLGDALQRAGLTNSQRDASIQELLTSRNQPINEISSLMNGGQVTLPQFSGYNAPSIAPADYAGAVQNNYNAQVAQANSANQQRASSLGGLYSLGGAALGGLFGGPLGASAGSRLAFGTPSY